MENTHRCRDKRHIIYNHLILAFSRETARWRHRRQLTISMFDFAILHSPASFKRGDFGCHIWSRHRGYAFERDSRSSSEAQTRRHLTRLPNWLKQTPSNSTTRRQMLGEETCFRWQSRGPDFWLSSKSLTDKHRHDETSPDMLIWCSAPPGGEKGNFRGVTMQFLSNYLFIIILGFP